MAVFPTASAVVDPERAELLKLLLRDGVLHRSKTQPIVSRDGTSARWMLDSLCVSLTPRGAELAGRVLLRLLERFDGHQLATFGVTGIPLLQSCLLQSKGRYRGLLVRKERKAHGSRKLIEGVLDPAEPVVIVDDSVSSGISVQECTAALEEAGLRVEGGVCLVRFGWYGGFALMQERGYRMEAAFDLWDDLIRNMADEEPYVENPTKLFPKALPAAKAAPDGLHPSELARAAVREYLRTGRVLRAPARLDQRYDAAGGTYVSLRSRRDVHTRYARNGFWHFPGEKTGTVAADLVQAAVLTAHELAGNQKRPLAALDDSAIAVTFFSALEECTVGELDNDRYGIVVRSRERHHSMGGALPRMPGIATEWEQLEHARKNNARLVSFEPFSLYRHEVHKVVEPGARWQPTGVPVSGERPWHEEPGRCGLVAQRARAKVLARLAGGSPPMDPLPEDLLPANVDSLFISVYSGGRLCGCLGAPVKHLERDLDALAGVVLRDGRFGRSADGAEPIAVSVSFLYDALELGDFSPEEVVLRSRHAEQALMAHQKDRSGILLPFVPVTFAMSPLEYAWDVIDKAGIARPPYFWRRFDCATWLADAGGVRKLEHALPRAAPPSGLDESLPKLRALLCGYVLRNHRPEGEPYGRYEPFLDQVHLGIETARLAHGAWTFARAGRLLERPELRAAAADVIAKLARATKKDRAGRTWVVTPGEPPAIAEVAFLLLAHCERGEKAKAFALAKTLWSCVDMHGRIATHRDAADDHPSFQDYFPGQALLALARAAEAGFDGWDEASLDRALKYYRHRFRLNHDWGAVCWLAQAFAAWWKLRREGWLAKFVFEVVDFALGHQQRKSGGFINGHQPDTPGFTTGLYLEGVAAALRVATDVGDQARRRRYLAACERGFAFLDRLVLQERDRALLPNPEFAFGAVRSSLVRSDVRIDFVQHALAAVLGVDAARQRR